MKTKFTSTALRLLTPSTFKSAKRRAGSSRRSQAKAEARRRLINPKPFDAMKTGIIAICYLLSAIFELASAQGTAFTYQGRLPKAICERNERGKEMARVLAQARSLLARPYNMGGRNSVTGIDCSGLVQTAYRTVGLSLARDAKQQYLNGNLILPCVAEALQPGDAIFFINSAGQVGHTGLYLGGGEMIHAQGEGVKIQSMNPKAKNYYERFDREFIGAKRYWW